MHDNHWFRGVMLPAMCLGGLALLFASHGDLGIALGAWGFFVVFAGLAVIGDYKGWK